MRGNDFLSRTEADQKPEDLWRQRKKRGEGGGEGGRKRWWRKRITGDPGAEVVVSEEYRTDPLAERDRATVSHGQRRKRGWRGVEWGGK